MNPTLPQLPPFIPDAWDPAEDFAAGFGQLMAQLHLAQGGDPADTDLLREAGSRAARAVSEGHACWMGGEGLPGDWAARLAASPVVAGDEAALTPLFLDPAGRLYLHRYRRYERRLATRLMALNRPAAGDPAPARGLLDALFPPGDGTDWQRVAAATALSRGLTVISGGPGTGKTATVVKILALLLSLDPALRIALAAPTGKAAARMQESVRRQFEALPLAAELKARLPDSSYTVHRLLGWQPGRVDFRHGADNPLPFDLVVVDEASMLDLALAAKLAEAVPAQGRLVLLGDKDQLAAVEAGAVFAALSRERSLGPGTAATLAALGTPVDTLAGAAPLPDAVVWLDRNYRFAADSGIGRLARAVQAGDAGAALSLLGAGGGDLSWEAAPPGPRGLAAALMEGYEPYVQALLDGAGPAAALAAFERCRVLAATHSGERGTVALNQRLAAAFRARLGQAPDAQAWFHGRPVVVTENDYGVGVFNGDVGLALAGEDGVLRVHFPQVGGGTRAIASARLPACQSAFAMTVHKAQGSEFERVELVLPARDNRVLSRELVYTGITRARERVRVWTEADVVARAAERRTERWSGLAEMLVEGR